MAQSGSSSAVDRSLVAVEVLVGVGVVAAIISKSYGPAPTGVFLLAGLSLAFTVFVLARMVGALRDPSLDVEGRVEDEDRAALEHEKLLILQGIKELEADAAIGKVDEEDYRHLRAKSEADALRIIKTLEAQDEHWMQRAQDLVREKVGAQAVSPSAPQTPAPAAAPAAAPVAEPAPATPSAKTPAAAHGAPVAIAGVFDDSPVTFAGGDDAPRCGACSTPNPRDARFCVGCGRPKAEVAA